MCYVSCDGKRSVNVCHSVRSRERIGLWGTGRKTYANQLTDITPSPPPPRATPLPFPPRVFHPHPSSEAFMPDTQVRKSALKPTVHKSGLTCVAVTGPDYLNKEK